MDIDTSGTGVSTEIGQLKQKPTIEEFVHAVELRIKRVNVVKERWICWTH